MTLATTAAGRTIHIVADVRLTPPETGELGHTDAAAAIGRGLVQEAFRLLKTAAEREGFTVEMTVNSVVF